MSLQSSTHSSQMNTEGPAMSLRTSCWLLPQNEQYSSRSPLPPLPSLPCLSLLIPRSSDVSPRSILAHPAGISAGLLWTAPGPPARTRLASSAPMKLSRSVSRSCDLLERLAGVRGQDLVQSLAQPQYLAGVDARCRWPDPVGPAARLVNHDAASAAGSSACPSLLRRGAGRPCSPRAPRRSCSRRA